VGTRLGSKGLAIRLSCIGMSARLGSEKVEAAPGGIGVRVRLWIFRRQSLDK
jgi:hypothetical protein